MSGLFISGGWHLFEGVTNSTVLSPPLASVHLLEMVLFCLCGVVGRGGFILMVDEGFCCD